MDSNKTDIEKSAHPLMPSKPADPGSEIATSAALLEKQNGDNQVENETQPKVPRKRSLHLWKILVFSLTVVAVLQLAGILVLTVAWRNKRNQALLPREQKLCVPCNVIQDTSDTIPEDFDIKPDALTNVTNCCNSVSEVLRLLINKQTAEQFYDGYASRMFSETADCPNVQKSKPAAMLAGIALENMVNENIVHWKRTDILEEHKEHIQHHNGKLSIKLEGYYFVYSQLKWKFRHDIKDNNKNDKEPAAVVNGNGYSHTVHLESRSSPILEGLKTSCDFEFERFEATSPLGAVFYLNKDETILVKTSHPQHLVTSHHSNFFGLYKL